MRKGIIYLLIVILLLATPTGLRYLRYYDLGEQERAAPPTYDPANIAQVPTPDASDYVDEPEGGSGFVLLDQAHRNNFELNEIGYLDGRLAARGFELLPYFGGDLATALRPVNAFLSIAPLDEFSLDEIQAVTDFVARGGRLLLVGDPTRFNILIDEEDPFAITFALETDAIPLNSLANEFDIIFNGDYLYNTSENEGNFRNIILNEAGSAEHDLVDGLQRLVFYGSHSLQLGPGSDALLEADENTWSSATDRPGGLTLAALGGGGRVLALGDINFLTQPYFTVYDNSHFIANIADFLIEPSDRSFVLADFPYFYRPSVDLIYTGSPDIGPDAFDEIIALQDAFRQIDQSLRLSAAPQARHDTLYLGLYNQADEVLEILASHGISLTIDPPILTEAELQEVEGEASKDQVEEDEPVVDEEVPVEDEPVEEKPEDLTRLVQSDLGNVQMSGTALILLHESDGRRNVVVLSASNDGLENTVSRLLDLMPLDAEYALADCLLQGNLAFCPSNVADEEVEAEIDTGGAPATPEEVGEVVEDQGDESQDMADEVDQTDGLGASNQGFISLGDTVEGSLAGEETHSWSFSEGPATVDIVVTAADLDIVLELYDPDDLLLDSLDSEFTGDGEQLLAVDIPDDGQYSILISDFFGDSGDYTLTVTLSDEAGQSGGIFIFADDDGEPLTSGFTSVDALATILSADYLVTTWIATEDGAIDGDALSNYELVIWDSGDYRDEEGFFDEDAAEILTYAENGGDLFITGVSPTILGDAELAQLADLEVTGDDPILLEGFNPGEIIDLDQVYDAVATGPFDPETDEGVAVFFVRGPGSEESGNATGIAVEENQKTVLLLAPFVALPFDVQSRLLNNLMTWFGLSGT
jgi:hypothetical protein